MEDDRGEDEYDYEYEDEDNDDEEMAPGAGSGGGSAAAAHCGGSKSTMEGSNPNLMDDCVSFINETQLKELMSKVVCDISETVNISTDAATALLRYFSWNRERLFDQFYSSPESVTKKVGIGLGGDHAAALGKGQTLMCRICCDDVQGSGAFALPCRHYFCKGCWKGYLSAKVSEGPICVYTTCPEHKCQQIVPESVFAEHVSEEELAAYGRFSLSSFVDINKTLRFCPGKDCGMVVKAPLSCPRVRCNCGALFCFRCGEETHEPATCAELEAWKEKCQNESETANWILANTKQCPKCKTRIEKNQGCNHMTCRQCKLEFCWICMGLWSEHGSTTGGYYKCNKYNAKDGAGDSAVTKAKDELDRYLHYCQRYQAHDHSQKMAEKQQGVTEGRMIELQESNAGFAWIDVQFLKSATEQLIECRRVLKYTYVMSYYIEEKTPAKELFEHHQENLEKYTEHLHELSEMPLASIDRTNIINYTRVTGRFCRSLLQSVKDGLDGASTDLSAAEEEEGKA
ncbi:unnamed protein product [Discosporangium mesarthrocarpum]